MMEAAKADALYDEALEYIESSRAKASKGKEVQIKPLEGKIAELCMLINSLPRDKAQKYEPKLQKLVTGLTALEEELVRQKEGVQGQLDELGRSHAANKAYVRSGGLQPVSVAQIIEDEKDT